MNFSLHTYGYLYFNEENFTSFWTYLFFLDLKKIILENVPKLREYYLELLEMIRKVLLEH